MKKGLAVFNGLFANLVARVFFSGGEAASDSVLTDSSSSLVCSFVSTLPSLESQLSRFGSSQSVSQVRVNHH